MATTKSKLPPPIALKCYCCGAALGDTFALVVNEQEHSDGVDRCFVTLTEHATRFDSATYQLVRRLP